MQHAVLQWWSLEGGQPVQTIKYRHNLLHFVLYFCYIVVIDGFILIIQLYCLGLHQWHWEYSPAIRHQFCLGQLLWLVQRSSQGTTFIFLNSFYNMEYKIIKKIRPNTTWIEADILGINVTMGTIHSPQPLSTSTMRSQSHSTPWRHNSNTKNVTASARKLRRK